MALSALNIQKIFRGFGHFRRLRYTNWLLLQNHVSHVILWVAFNLKPSCSSWRHVCAPPKVARLHLSLLLAKGFGRACTSRGFFPGLEGSRRFPLLLRSSFVTFACPLICPCKARERKESLERIIIATESHFRSSAHLRSDLQPSAVPSRRWRSPSPKLQN